MSNTSLLITLFVLIMIAPNLLKIVQELVKNG